MQAPDLTTCTNSKGFANLVVALAGIKSKASQ